MMSTEAAYLLGAVVVGLGATMFMDVWALFLKHAFSVPLANYCLVGRWIRHMPEGKFIHANIAAAPQKRSECTVGWIAHYVIGPCTHSCSSHLFQVAGFRGQPCCQPCFSALEVC